MNAPLQLSIKPISCLAVVLLTLWLSGFGCAFCCSTGLGNHCCKGNESDCATEAKADCCKSEKKSCALTETTGDAFSSLPEAGCPLLPNQTPSEFRQSHLINLIAVVLPVAPFMPQLEMDKYPPVFTNSLLPANRGSTYLRGCVFLI